MTATKPMSEYIDGLSENTNPSVSNKHLTKEPGQDPKVTLHATAPEWDSTYTYSENEGLIKLPYEYLPVPDINTQVTALDRSGQVVGTARVVKVQRIKGQERTPVIWLAVPKELVMSIRNIRVGG